MKKAKLISTLVVSVFALSLFASSALATLGAEDNAVVPRIKPPLSDRVCSQVITNATSPSGECKTFSTPCDVPEGWIVVSSCSSNAGVIIDDIDSRLQQLRKDKEDFKNSQELEKTELVNSLKEKVAAKRKLIEAKREELRIRKEEKRQAVLVRLLEIQIKQLKNTKERAAKMPNIKEDLKTSLNTKIDSAIAELNMEKTKVQNATASDDLKKLAKEIKDLFKSKREIVKAIVDAILASVADKNITIAENRLAELTAKIAELKAAGQNTTTLDNLLTIAKGKIEGAKTKAGKKELKEAVNDLKEAYKNMKSITEKTDSAE